MTLKCPCCGRTNAADNNTLPATMFFPVMGGNDKDLVFCVECRNVVSGPPGEDGCLFVPSDERLAAELTAIHQTAKCIHDIERAVNEKIEPVKPHNGRGEGHRVHDDGGIEFCFKKNRNEKFILNRVETILNKLGFGDVQQAVGTSRLCRLQCPSKKDYEHVRVKIVAVSVEAEDG